jgi:catechol 2,3-dioxygenase-like lactoylglutathione lyase family enzyme
MVLIEPGSLHRLALAVDNAGVVGEWFGRVLGASPLVHGTDDNETRTEIRSDGEADLEGTDTRMFRLGGYPFILLSKGVPGGPVAKYLTRYGPSVHSLAWEVGDMWTAQNLLIQRDIRIGAVNIPGRHFFMHPRDTHGVLMEWTDDTFGANGRQNEGGGAVDVQSLACVTAVVTDAEATAAFLAELAGARPIEGNVQGPPDRELTIDVEIGDMTLRMVTPRSSESPYASVLEDGPRLCSYAMRVADLDDALKALDAVGVPTIRRDGDVAATDPSTTFGLPMEWTS